MAVKSTTKSTSAPAAPALDFSALSAETVEEMPKSSRTPKVADTPFLNWLRETDETGKAKRVTVPEANVKDVENLVRQAANVLSKGAKIRKHDAGNGRVHVTFAATERRTYKPRASKSEK